MTDRACIDIMIVEVDSIAINWLVIDRAVDFKMFGTQARSWQDRRTGIKVDKQIGMCRSQRNLPVNS